MEALTFLGLSALQSETLRVLLIIAAASAAYCFVVGEITRNNRISIIGNPSIGNVRAIMIGVRNNSLDKCSAEVWVNELRLVGYESHGGSAAQGNLNVQVSDLATVDLKGMYRSAGYGGLEQGVAERSHLCPQRQDIQPYRRRKPEPELQLKVELGEHPQLRQELGQPQLRLPCRSVNREVGLRKQRFRKELQLPLPRIIRSRIHRQHPGSRRGQHLYRRFTSEPGRPLIILRTYQLQLQRDLHVLRSSAC